MRFDFLKKADTAVTIAIGGAAVGVVALVWWHKRKQSPKPVAEHLPLPTEEEKQKVLKQGLSALKDKNQTFDVIVIGSGMGGLTAATILAKQGYSVLVLEQHDIAGGNTHTFLEDGYEFDTGLHYVGGKIGVKSRGFRPMLDYVTDGQVEWEPMADEYDIAKLIGKGSEDTFPVHIHRRVNKAKLKEMFSSENEAIDRFFYLINQVPKWFPLHIMVTKSPAWLASPLRWMFSDKLSLFEKTLSQVLDELTQDQKLKGMLSYVFGDYGEVPERGAFLIHALVWKHYQNGAYYPVGGPLVIPYHMVRVIQQHGGTVCVRSPVKTLLLDSKGKAVGVQVRDQKLYAKRIISSVGIYNTILKIIPPEYQERVKPQLQLIQQPYMKPTMSLMSLFVGIEGTAEELNLPKSNYWVYPTWDHNQNWKRYQQDSCDFPAVFISFSSAKDPSYATRHGPNKQCALVIGPSIFEEVEEYKDKRVKHRGADYEAKKEKWTRGMLEIFCKEFPHLESRIKFYELGTAVTNDFYLGTHRGAVYGLAHTPERFATPIDPLFLSKSIPNLYLTGQDICGCGIATAIMSGVITAGSVSQMSWLRTGPLLAKVV